MQRIRVNTATMDTQAVELDSVAAKLGQISSSVNHVSNSLTWKISVSSAVKAQLRQQSANVQALGDRSHRLSTAVRNASMKYQATENQLAGKSGPEGAESSVAGQIGPLDFHTLFPFLENIYINHFPLISVLAPQFAPSLALAYLIGGIIYDGDASKVPTSSSYGDWFGYETDDDHPGVTGWIGRAHAERDGRYGSGEVNAYIGKGKAEAKAKAGFMQYKEKSEKSDGTWSEKQSLEFLYAEAGAGASVSVLSADASGSIGSDMHGLAGSAEVNAGFAEAEAKGKFSVGEDGLNAYAKGEAMVAAAKGKAKGTINIFGLEITGSVEGYAGAAGVEGEFGIRDNKFVAHGGVAAALGFGAGVEIGFNDTGWSNFVDFVTFWD